MFTYLCVLLFLGFFRFASLSHGLHSLYCDSRPAVGLQEVPGAFYLSFNFTIYKDFVAQESCPGNWHKWPEAN